MKEYIFPYGDGSVRVGLDEKQVLGVLRGHETPPIADIRAALWRSLNEPIDSAPLKEGCCASRTQTTGLSRINRGFSTVIVPYCNWSKPVERSVSVIVLSCHSPFPATSQVAFIGVKLPFPQ